MYVDFKVIGELCDKNQVITDGRAQKINLHERITSHLAQMRRSCCSLPVSVAPLISTNLVILVTVRG